MLKGLIIFQNKILEKITFNFAAYMNFKQWLYGCMSNNLSNPDREN